MVKEIKKTGKVFYICEECDLVYKEKTLADKCQKWCEKYKSCNLEITRHAVRLP